MTAIALTIAGSDSGGGAGIQADLKTFSANGAYGASVITALTAQNTVGVQDILDIPPDFIRKQLQSVFDDLRIDAVKIGMLANPAVIDEVGKFLKYIDQKTVILDPVMVATSGDKLLADGAVQSLIDRLFPLSLMITPNLHEAALILNTDLAQDRREMQEQAHALRKFGSQWVLIKGGHGNGPLAADLLVGPDYEEWLSRPRLPVKNTHGTGCTLSAAITAWMAKGDSPPAAARQAKDYISGAIAAGAKLNIGHGHGPVHHFYQYWS